MLLKRISYSVSSISNSLLSIVQACDETRFLDYVDHLNKNIDIAPPRIDTDNGYTILHYMSALNLPDWVEKIAPHLNKIGLHIDQPTSKSKIYNFMGKLHYQFKGSTPLHCSVESRTYEMAVKLLHLHADKTIENDMGLTPTDLLLLHPKLPEKWAKLFEIDLSDSAIIEQKRLAESKFERAITIIVAEKKTTLETTATRIKQLVAEDATGLSDIFERHLTANAIATPTPIQDHVGREIPEIYKISLFNSDFGPNLIAGLERVQMIASKENINLTRPNSMNNFGFVFDELGLNTQLKKVIDPIIQPIIKAKFGIGPLEICRAFVVCYRNGEDESLDIHVDNSKITLNICLGKEYSGANLYFQDLVTVPQVTSSEDYHALSLKMDPNASQYRHLPGDTLIHHGNHVHGVHQLESGERWNLIVWLR